MAHTLLEKRTVIEKALPHLDLPEEIIDQIGNLIVNAGKHQLAEEEAKEVEDMDRERIRRLQNLTWTRW